MGGTSLLAQSTNIAISNTPIQPSIKRFGINLGTSNFYDSGQISQNLLLQNPGFEGQIWNSIIRCGSGTPTSCTDDNQYSAWTAGFWNGASFEIFSGTAAGRTGTITSSTAPSGSAGITLNFSNSGTAPAVGDYVLVRKTVPGGSTGGWWPSTSGAGAITDNMTDLPPGTAGTQTAALSAPSAADSAKISGFFDSVAGKTFIQLNGRYQLQFKAKGTGGSNQVSLYVARSGGATYVNQPVTLTGAWNTYNINFTASETGSSVGTVGVTFSTVGADSFELDDVSLTKTNGDATNNTAFRDPVLTALRTLQPGIIRYWSGQLGDTLDNLLQPQFGRQRAGYSSWQTETDVIDYGLHDFLVLCQNIGAEPWFVVPSTFSTTDASNLMEYLAGSSATVYGAKRTALGQAAPWTQVFPKIHLEFGNEEWNPTFKGGSLEYPTPYGTRAQTIFAAMQANSAYAAGSFDLVLGGQAASPGRNSAIQAACNNNDSFSLAPYTMNTVDSFADQESLYGPTFAEPEALVSSTGSAEGVSPGMIYLNRQTIQTSGHPVPLAFYEVNMSTTGGAITQTALNSYVSSLGAGLMVADTMLQSLKQMGVVNQMLFDLPQYQFKRPDGSQIYLWGAVVDMGVTDRRRPQYLALQLANAAMSSGASLLQTTHTGADPTWNQSMVNTVQFNNAHYLQSYAFKNGGQLSAIVFNLSRTSALPVTFSGSNSPSGTVQVQQLTSANLSDSNESANVVAINKSTLSLTSGSSLSLPPYSMTVLTWGVQAAAPTSKPAPAISNVSATSVTSTSATINWTTDQASSAQVFYGTNSSYSSSSLLYPVPTTIHSVSLAGLTAGLTYNFEVVSTNATGQSTTSTSFTFTTPPASLALPTPKLANVAFWGVTSSGITASWSTEELTTTAMTYTPIGGASQTTPVQTDLAYNHGVVLTGLQSGTTYSLVAQSTNASGVVGYSTPYTFTTLVNTPPVISNIMVTPATNNTAAITWTTSTLANSYVEFGLTTTYNGWSTTTSLTTSAAPTINYIPSGLIHYRLVSTDAMGNQAVSPDYTFTEP